MSNVFVNLPVLAANGSGAAVDVSTMGAGKTIVVGGVFDATVTIEYATDDVGSGPWAPLPSGSFQQPGRVTFDFAAHWMRAKTSSYKSGSANADVGASDAGSSFVQVGSSPADISALPALKTVVSSGACIVEISEDGVSYSQAFAFQGAGGQTQRVYGQFARVVGGASVWMGGAGEGASTPAPEEVFWATQAALLDPRAYVLEQTQAGGLDVTVPAGRSWYAVNAFAVYYNDPIVYAQDNLPLIRRSGFIRPLDCRRPMQLSEGTRVRSNTGINVAYLYYCDPSIVWAIDPRYQSDPKGLYYSRLARLGTLPIVELVCEATGGGSIDDVVSVAIPLTVGDGMIIGASAYDACWATFGGLNLLDEINNSHITRMAETLLCPFQRTTLAALADGANFTLKKGTLSDGWSLNPFGTPYQSTDPATAYPHNGSANVMYQELPADW